MGQQKGLPPMTLLNPTSIKSPGSLPWGLYMITKSSLKTFLSLKQLCFNLKKKKKETFISWGILHLPPFSPEILPLQTKKVERRAFPTVKSLTNSHTTTHMWNRKQGKLTWIAHKTLFTLPQSFCLWQHSMIYRSQSSGTGTILLSTHLSRWFSNQHPHLGACEKCKVSGHISGLRNQTLGGWTQQSAC